MPQILSILLQKSLQIGYRRTFFIGGEGQTGHFWALGLALNAPPPGSAGAVRQVESWTPKQVRSTWPPEDACQL